MSCVVKPQLRIPAFVRAVSMMPNVSISPEGDSIPGLLYSGKLLSTVRQRLFGSTRGSYVFKLSVEPYTHLR